jgi:hypothetical protein
MLLTIPPLPKYKPRIITNVNSSGQFAIYGDIKKALGATGGVDLATK